METLLSKRSKNIIPLVILGFLGLITIGLLVKNPEKVSIQSIQEKLTASMKKMDARITRRVLELERRAEYLCDRLNKEQLDHSEMKNRESIILEKNGVVSEYFGEIYYFKFNNRSYFKWYFEYNRYFGNLLRTK